MVVGLTTTRTYRHKDDFKSHSWWGVHVQMGFLCVLLVSFTNITEILLKVELHSLTLLSARLVSFGWSIVYISQRLFEKFEDTKWVMIVAVGQLNNRL